MLVCSHHHMALAMMDAIKEAGLQCPDDISVVAFSHAEFDEIYYDGLTHMSWSGQEESREMLRLLTKQFSGIDKDPKYVRIPMNLTDGKTVKDLIANSE